jgi:hypothetical protein
MGVSGFDAPAGPISRRTQLGRAQYQLPDHASQGPSPWYIIHLHVAVTVSGSGGLALVSAATDGATAAQIDLQPTRSGVDWSAKSIAEPSQSGHSATGRAEIWFSNFLQYKGVVGGSNWLSAEAEAVGGARIDKVHVFGDTCIEATRRSPETLRAQAMIDRGEPQAGTNFRVRLHIKNVGSGAVGLVRLTLITPDRGIGVVGSRQLDTRNLRTEWSPVILCKALTPGTHLLHINVGTGLSEYVGGAAVQITVAHRGRAWSIWWLAGPAAGLGLVLAGFALHRFVRRPRLLVD